MSESISRRSLLTIGFLGAAAVAAPLTKQAIAAETSASDLDLTSMSLDDLISLRSEIDAEITTRLSSSASDIIYPGTYIVGTDIKPGTYLFTCVDGEDQSEVFLDSIGGSADPDAGDIWEFISPGDTISLPLRDGATLSIDYAPGTLSIQPTPSWAPDDSSSME